MAARAWRTFFPLPSFCLSPVRLWGLCRENGVASLIFFWKFFQERETIEPDAGVRSASRFSFHRGAAVIDQKYLQCHFFSSQTKDGNMHRKKPQSGRVYRIGEAARALNLQTSVLRFWEGEFPGLQPVRTPKGQRLYTESDMALLRKIRSLLHEQGMTIEGARRVLAGEAMPELAEALSVRPAPQEPKNADVLREILRELIEVRAMLSANLSKENRS